MCGDDVFLLQRTVFVVVFTLKQRVGKKQVYMFYSIIVDLGRLFESRRMCTFLYFETFAHTYQFADKYE